MKCIDFGSKPVIGLILYMIIAEFKIQTIEESITKLAEKLGEHFLKILVDFV